MPLDYSRHSLALLQGMASLATSLEDMRVAHDETIIETEHQEGVFNARAPNYFYYTIAFAPRNQLLKFYFKVVGARDAGNGHILFTITFKPESGNSTNESSVEVLASNVVGRFKNWIDLIKSYNKIKLSRKEQFIHDSAQQFYSDFELADEDANTAPFDNDRQVLVFKLLEFVKNSVAQEDDSGSEEAQDIMQQIRLLQENIPIITKNAVIKELSRVFAKVKSYSIKAFVMVYDVATKELIKYYLHEGLDKVSEFIDKFHLPPH